MFLQKLFLLLKRDVYLSLTKIDYVIDPAITFNFKNPDLTLNKVLSNSI